MEKEKDGKISANIRYIPFLDGNKNGKLFSRHIMPRVDNAE